VLPSREELALTIDEAEWSLLRMHLERGRLILVDDSLDLADTALKVAADDSESVQHLLSIGKLGAPSPSQLRSWDSDTHKRFAMLIVSPYVLIQERMPVFH
jgi:hypothetical protein